MQASKSSRKQRIAEGKRFSHSETTWSRSMRATSREGAW